MSNTEFKMLFAASLILTIYFLVAAIRITKAIRKESAIFREFNQSQILKTLIWFFPIGPLLIQIGPFYMSFIVAFVVCIGCYVPAVIIARKNLASFARTGTDRVTKAETVVSQVFGNGIAGIIYAVVNLLIVLGVQLYAPTS